jgi:enoyl-CoA hydratase/carnithine racemase
VAEPEITDSGIGVVTIDNPRKLNAWTGAMRVDLAEQITALADAPRSTCAAVVVTGAGTAFCSGQDLDEVRDYTPEAAAGWVRGFWDFYNVLRRCPKPVVAAINGVAAGSGLQFALCADHRVTHPGARIGQPELRSGQAGVTGNWLLSRAVGNTRMRSLALGARMIDGEEAYRIGLVDELVPEDEVRDAAVRTARRMADLPPATYAETKLALCELEDPSFATAFEIAERRHAQVYSSGAPAQAIGSFTARRKSPDDRGSRPDR